MIKPVIESGIYAPKQQKRKPIISERYASEMLFPVRFQPLLPQDAAMRRFFCWTTKGHYFRDTLTNEIVLPYQTLSRVIGCNPRKGDKGLWLDSYRREFDPAFRWRDYWHEGKRCRSIIETGTSAFAKKMLFTNMRKEQRVYLHTGKMVTQKSILAAHKEKLEQVRAIRWDNPDQQLIADTLHNLPYTTFARCLDEQYDRAFHMAVEQQNETWARNLQTFLDQPYSYYKPTKKEKTLRMYGSYLPYMPTKLRHELFPSFIDLDIRSCQLTIIAELFEISSVQKLLDTGHSPWKTLLDDFALPEKAKSCVKRAVYSIIYGMKTRGVNKAFREELKKECEIVFSGRFCAHPLIADIVKALSEQKEKILQQKGMQTPYGFQRYSASDDMNSFLACCIQAYELYLITSCYKLLARQRKHHNDRFRIVLHQHDGISIEIKKRVDRKKVIAQLQKAVKKAGKEFGMHIFLEVKDMQENDDDLINNVLHDLSSSMDERERQSVEEECEQEERGNTSKLSPIDSWSDQRSASVSTDSKSQKIRNFTKIYSSISALRRAKKRQKAPTSLLWINFGESSFMRSLRTFGTQNTS